jgi:hypothetical protein
MVNEVFGVKGQLGDLVLEPKLLARQFDADGQASVLTQFAGRTLDVIYHNPDHLSWEEYTIVEVRLNGQPLPHAYPGKSVRLPRSTITDLTAEQVHTLDLFLAEGEGPI